MQHTTNRLTEHAVRQSIAEKKPRKFSDGAGLHLLVLPSGAKYWRMAYRFAGKQKLLALGVYPETTLKKARAAAIEAREDLRNKVDPSELRRLQKFSLQHAAANSFRAIALEWFAKQKPAWAEAHWTKVEWMLESNLFPRLGERPISEITAPELLACLRRIEARRHRDSEARQASCRPSLPLCYRDRPCRARSIPRPTRCARGTS